ncbi:MAG: hypothetical protein HQL30_11700 [Candidatus Omnitrophica bacterium]|nr:hypothetical protein [Candidatus Omnitrophota bacterium]
MKTIISVLLFVGIIGVVPSSGDDATMNAILSMLGGGGQSASQSQDQSSGYPGIQDQSTGYSGDTQASDYYTDPRSRGYFEQKFGGLCRRCGEVIPLSYAEVSENRYVFCPNCKTVNNPAQANEYYRSRQGGARGSGGSSTIFSW